MDTRTARDTATGAAIGKARFLHTMLRVFDLKKSLDFYAGLLGMEVLRQREVPEGRYTLSQGDGGTRVRFELSATLSGLKRVMSSPVQKSMNAEVGNLAKLKQVLETDAR